MSRFYDHDDDHDEQEGPTGPPCGHCGRFPVHRGTLCTDCYDLMLRDRANDARIDERTQGDRWGPSGWESGPEDR